MALVALASASVVAFFGFYVLAVLADERSYVKFFSWQVDPNKLGVALMSLAAALGLVGLVALRQALRLERRS
jgi:hypothetical protein